MISEHPKEQEQIVASFAGANERYEIEDVEEFRNLIKGQDPKTLSLKGWVFQEVDLSQEKLDQFNFKGAFFLGCTLPEGVKENDLRAQGAHVMENSPFIPFKPFRAFMYTIEEIQEKDGEIYKFYLEKTDVISTSQQSIHDYSIKDALYDYLEGKSVVSIMGGHATHRDTKEYRDIVLLGRKLAREGFLVTTGGGPGAMEAANLGAYLANKDDAVLDDVLKILQEGNDKFPGEEYKNTAPADKVLEKYGSPQDLPSLGVPTWKYGHEPSNRFAAWHAKFFSNAIREDGLITISNCGIIFTPGSAGTRQEIFQNACQNHYSNENECSPMIFLGNEFWKKDGVYQLVEKTAAGRAYAEWLKCTDSIDDVVDSLIKFRKVRRLPVLKLEQYKGRFWDKSALHEDKEGKE